MKVTAQAQIHCQNDNFSTVFRKKLGKPEKIVATYESGGSYTHKLVLVLACGEFSGASPCERSLERSRAIISGGAGKDPVVDRSRLTHAKLNAKT